MIDAIELRIGNWVINPNNQKELQITPMDICDIDNNIKSRVAIPLTEQWLLDFGFQSNPYQDRYENGVINIECNKLRGETELWIDRFPHIKHVHQLQNLFYALAGQELELNKK